MSDVGHGHTVRRYDEELQRLERRVLRMGELVRAQLQGLPRAIDDRREGSALAVADADDKVDAMELKVDRLIINVMARRAPAGVDLRFVVAVSRMVTDLERIGDEAASIGKVLAERQDSIEVGGAVDSYAELAALSNLADQLLGKAMLAFDEHSEVTARELAFGAATPNGELFKRVQALSASSREEGVDVAHAVNLVLVARSLERIVASICNIAEHVIYLVSGEDVRHG